MVVRTDDHDDHDCERCPACRLRAALAGHLVELAAGRESDWHDTTAGIMAMLTVANSALASLRAERFAGSLENVTRDARSAATALVALVGEIEQLRELLDDDADDQDDG